MKTVAILVVCAFMACLFIEGKADCPPFPNATGPSVPTGTKVEYECAIYLCGDNAWSTAGCGTFMCKEGTQIGWRETNLKKSFPECCAGPICKPDEE